jgi:hypothetical protein
MTNRLAHLAQRLRQVEGMHGEHTFVLHFPDGATISKDVRRPLELFLAVCELTVHCLREHGLPDLAEQQFQCLTEKRLRLIQIMGRRHQSRRTTFFLTWAHAVHACKLANGDSSS